MFNSENNLKKFWQTFKESAYTYGSISIWLFICGIGLRLIESILLSLSYGRNWFHYLLLNTEGIGFDIIYYCRFSLFALPLFALFYYWTKKNAVICFRIFFTLLIAISTAFVIYYVMAGSPLDRLFFMYSWNELIHTVNASTNSLSFSYLFVLLFPLLFFILSRKILNINKVTIYVLLLTLIVSIGFIWKPEKLYRSHKEYYTAITKVHYFSKSVIQGVSLQKYTPSQLESMRTILHQTFPDLNFTNDKYPFQHIDNTEDVLSSSFRLSKKKPNFVFIISEGLAREFSGKNTYYPSATPFLDLLAQEGLSWENCFSTTYRTIGVLPALFGALPYGNGGFMSYKDNMPEFQSLLTILEENGYTSTFYYGGWCCFDNMCHFLKRNKCTIGIDEKKEYDTKSKNEWGLYDHILFQQSVKQIDFNNNNPRIDIYMTLSTHQPFDFPKADAYVNAYKQKIDASGPIYEKEEIPYLPLASFQYYDDCLRQLFAEYSKKSDFENTIFIITGDHNFNMQSSSLDICRVPLVIWSPMLIRKASYPACVSHRDVTPSLLSFLKKSYSIKTPQEVAWLSYGLDTVSSFRSRIFCPQLDQSRTMSSIMYKEYYYYENQLYKIEYTDGKIVLGAEVKAPQIVKEMENYKKMDVHVMDNDLLIDVKGSNFTGR